MFERQLAVLGCHVSKTSRLAGNACGERCQSDVGRFVADHIARTLAGVTSRGRPIFLKIAYHGPAAMEALVAYDRSLVVGILGGSAGTTMDAFHMLWEAKKYGARAALYGRKINHAEHQQTFVRFLRLIADDQIAPEEAVRAYHGELQRLGIRPHRTLEADLQRGETATSYSGSSQSPSTSAAPGRRPIAPLTEPDFSKMTTAEKVQWNLERWKRIIG